MPKPITDPEIERQVFALVEDEKSQWEDCLAFVTDKVAFDIRNLIRTLRKNYYGIFDEEHDQATGAKKTWIPLTESTVESIVKNIDLDTKDINFRAKKFKAIGLTAFLRNAVKAKLDQMYFGEYLDDLARTMAIDGTAVWKTYVTNEDGKKTVRIQLVDLLNFYIDPTAENIQKASAVIERALLGVGEIKSMTGWKNTEDLKPSVNLSRNDPRIGMVEKTEKLVDVYERWGLMSESLITGKEKDKDNLIEGHIVVSGIDGKDRRVHLVERNTNKDSTGRIIKPYEEIRYKKVPGRWHGRGPAEALLMLQLWLNTVVNIRITRAKVSQLGLFKIRKGANITPQMLSKLPVNGAIVVNQMEDIQQFVVQEASQASYADENTIQNWSERVTSAFESVTGESLPASTPATNAVLQSRIAQSQFVMIKEQIGMFLQRWLKRHYLPKLGVVLSKDEILAIEGSTEEIEEMDDKIVNKLLFDDLTDMQSRNVFANPAQVVSKKKQLKDKIKSRGERFVKLIAKPETSDYEVQVYVTNEEIDKGVLVQNLISVLQTIPNIPGININPSAVIKSVFDIMGLDTKQFETKESIPVGGVPSQPQPVAQENQATPTEQRITTAANTAGIA